MVFEERKRELGERIGPVRAVVAKIELKAREGALEQARSLDNPRSWKKAADIAYGLWDSSGDIEAGVFLVQMLVNLGNLDQAQEWLDKLPQDDLKVVEKQGWVDDLTGRYEKAEADFQKVLEGGNMESQSYKTAIHFLGRAKYGLGKISEARKQFDEDLARAKLEGNKIVQAFNLKWLAKCDLAQGKLDPAKEKLEEINKLGVIGPHASMVEGMVQLEEGQISAAREAFAIARKVWQADEPYPRGAADALAGQAVCDLLEGKEMEALEKAKQAAKEHPWVWGYLS